jgi:prevent-host-death family protein
MKQLEISEARIRLNSIDDELSKDHIILVTRHQKPAFVLVSIEYFEIVTEFIEILADPEDRRLLQEAINDIRSKV